MELSGISLEYEKGTKVGNIVNILVKITSVDGIKEIRMPDQDILHCNGKTEIEIHYKVEYEVKYIFTIITTSGKEKQETVKLEKPEPIVRVSFNEYREYKSEVKFKICGNTAIELSDEQYKQDGNSCYFSGTGGQKLTLDTNKLDFGTSDFTVEFWSYAETQITRFPVFFANDTNTGLTFICADEQNGGYMSLVLGANYARSIGTTKKYTPNEWIHYALVRKDGIFTLYENGINIGSTDLYKSYNVNFNDLAIGGNQAAGLTEYKGYIDEFLIYDRALYTENFNEFIIEDDFILYSSFDSDIEYLLNIKNAITDEKGSLLFDIRGNSQIELSDKQYKQGGKSCYLPGTVAQRLTVETTDKLNFGTSDFTIEFWSYAEAQIMPYPLFFGSDNNVGLEFFCADQDCNGNISLVLNEYKRVINSNKKYTPNEWMHYALVRKDGIFTLYENGINIGSTDLYINDNVDLSNLAIGGNQSTSNTAYKGYIDEFLIYDEAIY